MFGFQTLACLYDIPVVRSSTNILQDVYTKAKDKSLLIRLSCNLVEIVADKSLKIACTIANPFVKPLNETVRAIDDLAVEKIRQIEAKYPVINISTEEVMNTLNGKSKLVRQVMNCVKNTTTSTMQQGQEPISNVATATVNKATNVADTLYTFCETHIPGKTIPVHYHDFSHRTTLLWKRLTSSIGLNLDYLFHFIQFLLIWYRILIISFLLKIKQTNDDVFNKIQQKSFLSVLLQRILILTGTFIEYMIARIRLDDKRATKEHSELIKQKHFISRQTLKPGALVTRQTVLDTQQDTGATGNSSTKSQVNKEEFSPRLTADNVHKSKSTYIESVSSNNIEKIHDQLKPYDIELFYSRLPTDVLLSVNNHQMIHEKLINDEEENQGYVSDEDNYGQ